MKRALLALVLLGLGCGRTVSQPRPEVPPVEARVIDPGPTPVAVPLLSNALRPLVEQRNPGSPLVTVRVVFEAGSADDPPDREGLTRLTARLMAEGGTQALRYEAFTRALFPMAGRIEYYVDRDVTVFSGTVHRDQLARFYPLLRDVLLAPRLAEEDFTRVRRQSRADLTLQLRGSSDEELGKEVLQSVLYRGHPYAHPALGTEAGLDASTLAELVAHRAEVFSRGRVLIGLAGAYPEDFAETVRNDFAQLPVARAARAALPSVARPSGGLHVLIVDKPTASATAFSMGFPLGLTRRDAEHASLQFVTNYLGLHRQSVGVLYQTLREARGLNYGDYAYAEHYAQDGWSRFPRPNIVRRQQYASLWLRPVPDRYAHFALRGALRAVEQTANQGLRDDDITRIRTFLNGYVGLYTQTDGARLGFALDDALDGAAEPWATRQRRAWSGLTAEALREVARRHLGSHDLWVVVVSPQAQRLADALVADAPSPITYDSPKPDEVLAEDREIASYGLHIARENVQIVGLERVFATRDWLTPQAAASAPATP